VPASTSPLSARPIDRILEAGIGAVLILAPLPFGAVTVFGRLALETATLFLVLVWAIAGWTGELRFPPRRVLLLLGGLLLLGSVQTIPLGEGLIRVVSPKSLTVRESVTPPAEARLAEERLLQIAPSELDSSPTLSVEPGASASALRTGAALCALLLISAHVAATRGLRGMATALLASAAFQSLYGLTVLATGFDRIWHVEKTVFLDAATGTWVNRNHFANYLAMALPCGAALWVAGFRRTSKLRGAWLVRTFSSEGSRNLLRLLALVIGMAGLLVSLSRAGIVLGLTGVATTLWLGVRFRPPTTRVLIVGLALAIAAVPLAQLGTDALWGRFETSAEDMLSPGSRGTVWRDTLDVARSFPVVGSGFGTFASIYPKFRSAEVRPFFSYAHNDPIQFVAEGGALGLLLLLALLASLSRRILAALRGEHGALGIGVAVGLMAALLHSLIDFNFHLPANAAVAVVLAGSMWGLPSKQPT